MEFIFQYTSLIVLRLMTFSIDLDLSEASNDRFKNTNEPFGPISTHMYTELLSHLLSDKEFIYDEDKCCLNLQFISSTL